jgi:hypothetical protein
MIDGKLDVITKAHVQEVDAFSFSVTGRLKRASFAPALS